MSRGYRIGQYFQFIVQRNVLPWVISFLVLIILGIIAPSVLSGYSLTSMIVGAIPIMLMAAGEIVVMITGSIDLSLASSLGFASMIGAIMISNANFPGIVVFPIICILGAVIGLVNGLVITKGKLQSFIVTLGTGVILRGLMLVFSGGTSIPLKNIGKDPLFSFLVKTVGGIPLYSIIAILVVALLAVIITNTRFGRYLYALGGNEIAARMVGLKADRLRIQAFVIAGILYDLGGITLLLIFGSGWPQAGSGWEMDGIAASVLGGANFAGGVGSPLGAIPGAIILDLITRFLAVLGINPYWQSAIKGIFVIGIAVALARGEYGR